MLFSFMFSSPLSPQPAPRSNSFREEIARPIIFPTTSLESTVTQVFIPLHLNFPRINTYEKPGGRVLIIVNQISDEEICPDERREERPLFSRDDRRFRPCRKACLSRGASRRDTSLAITSLSHYLTDSLTPRRLDQNAIPSLMLKWSRTQGATRFRRKLSRPEGMPGPTCP